jgi:uncharacterized protein with PIN domain
MTGEQLPSWLVETVEQWQDPTWTPDVFRCPDCTDDMTEWADGADWQEIGAGERVRCQVCGR